MSACKSILTRADRDFSKLHAAWGRLRKAQGRLHSLKTYNRSPSYKAMQKARVAVDQADSAVRAASARVERATAAATKCLRRTGR